MENHCPHLAPSSFSLKIQKGILFGHYTKKRSAAVFFVDFHKKVCYHIVDIVLFCAVFPPCPKSMPFEASKESILPYAAVYSLTPLFLHMVSYAVFPVDAVRRATSERDSDGAFCRVRRNGILSGDHRSRPRGQRGRGGTVGSRVPRPLGFRGEGNEIPHGAIRPQRSIASARSSTAPLRFALRMTRSVFAWAFVVRGTRSRGGAFATTLLRPRPWSSLAAERLLRMTKGAFVVIVTRSRMGLFAPSAPSPPARSSTASLRFALRMTALSYKGFHP